MKKQSDVNFKVFSNLEELHGYLKTLGQPSILRKFSDLLGKSQEVRRARARFSCGHLVEQQFDSVKGKFNSVQKIFLKEREQHRISLSNPDEFLSVENLCSFFQNFVAR